ncbi:MAG: HigA family addiction module antitoxin [Bdellovibrionota bacterium]
MITRKRKPTSPGEILKEEFLVPMGITQKKLADHIGVDIKVINRIINAKCSVTADVAVRLAAALKTTAEFWLNAQKALDLYKALEKNKKLPSPLPHAA